MSFVSQYLTPFFRWYDRKIDGEYLSTQLQFKGSNQAGGDYSSKVSKSIKRDIQAKYEDSFNAVKEPCFCGFLQDNAVRLLLNPFDRLIAAYQAYPTLKTRFTKPGTFSYTFTQIMNQGLIMGGFKGFIYNFSQFGLILYPSVYLTNKSGSDSKFFTFLSTYTFLDALFYPVDTLKNILYADTLGHYSFKTVATKIDFANFYNGLLLKLTYNLPVLSGIYCTTQVGYETQALVSWALAFLLYPLNTQKVRSQVSGSFLTSVSERTGQITHSQWRGAFSYILINAAIGYCLRPLFSQQKLQVIKSQVQSQLKSSGLNDVL